MTDTRPVTSTHGSNGQRPESAADRIRASLLDSTAVKDMVPSGPVVDGLLYRNTLAMLYGAAGLGKSFVAMDIALHVASGSWWHKREVSQGPVLYVAAEGAAGYGKRIDAWERWHHMRADRYPMLWLPWAVNVYDRAWAAALADVVGELQPVLVVLDTFARCALGAEENSARDIGRIVSHLDAIRRRSEACVWLIHHAGKNADAGARGSSALRGAMDTELEVLGESRRFHLFSRKQKDAPELAPFALGLRPVPDSQSVVVDAPEFYEKRLLPGAGQTLGALMDIDVAGGVAVTAWKVSSGVPERTFYNHRKWLLDSGQVVNVGSDRQPRYRPAPNLKPQDTESGE